MSEAPVHRAGRGESGRAESPEGTGQQKFTEPSIGSERFWEKETCGSAGGPLKRSAEAASTRAHTGENSAESWSKNLLQTRVAAVFTRREHGTHSPHCCSVAQSRLTL